MENVVDTGVWRQQQSVGQTAYPFQHFIRPIVLRHQLGLDTISHSFRCVLVQAQPYQVAHRELERLMQLVVRRLHKCLGMEKSVPDLGEECVPISYLTINRSDVTGPCLEQDHGGQRMVVDHLNGGRAEHRLI
jgi:hypothetical protein